MSKRKPPKPYVDPTYFAGERFEMFHDECYYDMFCVRPIGARDFNDTAHEATHEAAKELLRSLDAEEVTWEDTLAKYNTPTGKR